MAIQKENCYNCIVVEYATGCYDFNYIQSDIFDIFFNWNLLMNYATILLIATVTQLLLLELFSFWIAIYYNIVQLLSQDEFSLWSYFNSHCKLCAMGIC